MDVDGEIVTIKDVVFIQGMTFPEDECSCVVLQRRRLNMEQNYNSSTYRNGRNLKFHFEAIFSSAATHNQILCFVVLQKFATSSQFRKNRRNCSCT